MNIIVIDDEPAPLLTFASHIFDNSKVSANMFSYRIDDALKYVKHNSCKAAFLDINMPQMNGIDLAEKLIEIAPEIKIVFITGYAQNIDEIKKRIGSNFFDFCYKPYDALVLNNILTSLIEKTCLKVEFKTFPNFDCYVANNLVDFGRAKSKELLALLVDRRGSMVTMEEAISCLWGDKDISLAKILYRDAVCRLRLALKKYHIPHIVDIRRARLSLKLQDCKCDVWDYLDGKNVESFLGEYMRPYEWSVERECFLSNLNKKY